MTLLCVGVWPYLFCYFANFALDRMANIRHSVYNLNWLDFPIDLQKYCIVIIAQSQRNVWFHGLKLIACSLPNFGKVYLKIIIDRSTHSAFWCSPLCGCRSLWKSYWKVLNLKGNEVSENVKKTERIRSNPMNSISNRIVAIKVQQMIARYIWHTTIPT